MKSLLGKLGVILIGIAIFIQKHGGGLEILSKSVVETLYGAVCK